MKIFSGILIALLLSTTIYAADKSPSPLSELSQLKAENLKLKTTIAQLQANMMSCQLSTEQTALLVLYRKELHADEAATFDWNTLQFTTP